MKVEHSIGILEQGVMLGEIALISNCARTATVRCLNYNILEEQSEESFKEMLRLFPEVIPKFKQKRSEYNDKWKIFLRGLIINTEYFKDLPPFIHEELMYSLKPYSYEEESIIFTNGDTIQKLFYVSEGEISIVLQLDNGEEVITDMLSQGNNFGAYSLLKDKKQMFTFKTNSYVTLLAIDREALNLIREEFKDLDSILLKEETYIETNGFPT